MCNDWMKPSNTDNVLDRCQQLTMLIWSSVQKYNNTETRMATLGDVLAPLAENLLLPNRLMEIIGEEDTPEPIRRAAEARLQYIGIMKIVEKLTDLSG